MAASSSSSRAILLSTLLSSCVILSFPSSSTSSRILSADSEKKVTVGVYYEALCPGSSQFVSEYVDALFQDKELLSIIDVHLVPWGNTRIVDNNTIWCQHGLPECLLDTVEACVIDLWPKVENHFPFIQCVEALAYEDYDKAVAEWESCFEKSGLDEKSVLDCTRNGRGQKRGEREHREASPPPREHQRSVAAAGSEHERGVAVERTPSERSVAAAEREHQRSVAIERTPSERSVS